MSIPSAGTMHSGTNIRSGRVVTIGWVTPIYPGRMRKAVATTKTGMSMAIANGMTITVSIAWISFGSWFGSSFTLVNTVDIYIGMTSWVEATHM